MFRLHLVPGRLGGGDWQLVAGRIVGRHGCLEPFAHPMVEARALAGPSGRLGIAVFERPHAASSVTTSLISLRRCDSMEEAEGFRQLRDKVMNWPLHWFWIEIDVGAVSIQASDLPTVPVFVAQNAVAAIVDWDPLALYGYIDPLLDIEVAADYLARFDQPYAARTAIRQIGHVAAGHLATWRAGECWSFVPPTSQLAPHARHLEKAADPVRSFGELLDSALKRLLPDPAVPLAAGLSGGLDSSAVVAAARRRGHRVDSFGLVMPGADGMTQQARRQAVIDRFQLRDHAHPACYKSSCWADYGRAVADRMVPWEERHHDLLDGLYARAAENGHACFLTGVGGDELLMPYWDEMADRDESIQALRGPGELPAFLGRDVREGRETRFQTLMAMPRAHVQKSVMDVVAGSAAQLLRHGLWPIHPLATPELARYCHGLPLAWREDRRTVREWLGRQGLPPAVTHPPSTESFANISTSALTQCPPHRGPLHTPRLADLGLVDPTAVAPAYRAWLAGTAPASWKAQFIAMTVLETTLTSIANTPRKSPTQALVAV